MHLDERSHWENDGPTAMAIHIVGNVEELGLVCGTEVLRASAADSDTRVKQNGEGRRQGKVTHNGRSDGEGTGHGWREGATGKGHLMGGNKEENGRDSGRRDGHSWCWRCCREGHKVAQRVVVVDSAFDDQQNHHQGVQQHRVDGTRGRHGATRLCTTQAGHERQMDRLR